MSTNKSFIELVKENMPDTMLYKLDQSFDINSVNHLNTVNESELLINNHLKTYFPMSKTMHCCRICGILVTRGDKHYDTHLHSLECPKCGFFFSGRATTDFKKHLEMKNCDKKIKYKCESCGSWSNETSSLSLHKNSIHLNKTYNYNTNYEK